MIKVVKGDITRIEADAIVNAANSTLMGGGGVDGAIHRAGGIGILNECKEIIDKQGSCKTGDAVITNAGKLPAKFVIHTVGPIWRGGKNNEREKLASCYTKCLELATQHNCKSIAFPNISTGAYGFPKPEAARIAVRSIREFLLMETSLHKIIFVCFDEENERCIRKELENYRLLGN